MTKLHTQQNHCASLYPQTRSDQNTHGPMKQIDCIKHTTHVWFKQQKKPEECGRCRGQTDNSTKLSTVEWGSEVLLIKRPLHVLLFALSFSSFQLLSPGALRSGADGPSCLGMEGGETHRGISRRKTNRLPLFRCTFLLFAPAFLTPAAIPNAPSWILFVPVPRLHPPPLPPPTPQPPPPSPLCHWLPPPSPDRLWEMVARDTQPGWVNPVTPLLRRPQSLTSPGAPHECESNGSQPRERQRLCNRRVNLPLKRHRAPFIQNSN